MVFHPTQLTRLRLHGFSLPSPPFIGGGAVAAARTSYPRFSRKRMGKEEE